MKLNILSDKSKKICLFTIFLLIITIAFNFLSINSFATASSSGNLQHALNGFLDTYSFYFNIFLGFVIATNLLIFIYHFSRLGATSSNPQERAKTLKDMLISGVCLAIIGGGAVIIYVLFYLGHN